MALIDLRYGSGSLPFSFDDERFALLAGMPDGEPLTDAEIDHELDHPIDSPQLEDAVPAGESVLIVVPDATREVGCGQIVNLIVRRLISNGTLPHQISIIFATGIHRPVTSAEKARILTPFIYQRIKTLDHDPRDLARLVRIGETGGGIPVEVDRAVTENDRIILIGGVTFHYFAGFAGGRKLICPGVASTRTIAATHKLAFDVETRSRRHGVGTGMLDGNAVHEAFMDAVSLVSPSFAVTTRTNSAGDVTGLFCGDWRTSHRVACGSYSERNTVLIDERRDIAIVSCGGSPHDINLIQAHKALNAACDSCKPGGKLILLAECSDGLGREDMLKWFEAGTSEGIADRLCTKYQVNGQTAWNLRRITENYDVGIITNLDDDTISRIGMRRVSSIEEEIKDAGVGTSGYLIPDGRIRVSLSKAC